MVQLEDRWFFHPEGLHGLSHTRRVLRHAALICEALELRQNLTDAVVQAAAWHDIGRTHDGRDWTHGMKSVTKVLELGLHKEQPRELADLALFAVEFHATWDWVGEARASLRADAERALLVLKILKDADGLDRVRLGDLDES